MLYERGSRDEENAFLTYQRDRRRGEETSGMDPRRFEQACRSKALRIRI
jgi:hypothetical protein